MIQWNIKEKKDNSIRSVCTESKVTTAMEWDVTLAQVVSCFKFCGGHSSGQHSLGLIIAQRLTLWFCNPINCSENDDDDDPQGKSQHCYGSWSLNRGGKKFFENFFFSFGICLAWSDGWEMKETKPLEILLSLLKDEGKFSRAQLVFCVSNRINFAAAQLQKLMPSEYEVLGSDRGQNHKVKL